MLRPHAMSVLSLGTAATVLEASHSLKPAAKWPSRLKTWLGSGLGSGSGSGSGSGFACGEVAVAAEDLVAGDDDPLGFVAAGGEAAIGRVGNAPIV
jgi:hypothetical protein